MHDALEPGEEPLALKETTKRVLQQFLPNGEIANEYSGVGERVDDVHVGLALQGLSLPSDSRDDLLSVLVLDRDEGSALERLCSARRGNLEARVRELDVEASLKHLLRT